MNGAYDEGYAACPCFWGRQSGSLMQELEHYHPDFSGLRVLDVGCGEGKNAIFLAKRGAFVRACDISERAIQNAKQAWPDHSNIFWEIADIRSMTFSGPEFDIIVAYGLFHCLSDLAEVSQTVVKLQNVTRPGGFHVVCAFNDRYQDLDLAHPGFFPVLLSHEFYLQSYSSWTVLHATDRDLNEAHPHNNIPHTHSMSRLIVRKQ
jgi:tellurite methyltransferase